MKKHIPPLRFNFLTKFFDSFLRICMKEYKIKNEFINLAKIKKNDKILDLGCCTGTLLKILAKKKKTTKIYGIDINISALKIAKNKLINTKTILKKYNGIKIPFEDNFFDTIFSSLVIHHIPKKDRVLIFFEIKRVLKEDGNLFILDFGKQQNIYGKLITSIIKLIEPIEDNLKGKIPFYLKQTKFKGIKGHKHYKTLFGELTIYSGKK